MGKTTTTTTDAVTTDGSHEYHFEGYPSDTSFSLQPFGNNVVVRVSDSDYKNTIARRGNATNPYYKLHNEASFARCNSSGKVKIVNRWYDVSGYTTWHGGLYPLSAIPSHDQITDADDIALKRLKGKLATEVGSFKALVPLGEIKELRGLVRNSAEVTAEFLKAAVGLKKRGGVRRMKVALSKLWLQYSFAVAPTVGAINDLSESVLKTLDREHCITLHGQKTVTWRESNPSVGFTGSHSGCNVWAGPVESHHTYRVRYSAGFKILIQSLNNYSAIHYGLTLNDVPSAAYELTAFSWVADYFSNLGDVIEDVFSAPPGSTYFGSKSSKYVREQSVVLTPRANSVNAVVSGSPVTNVSKCLIFERSSLTTLPHRSFRFKSMDEIGVNAVPKVLNLASILLSK